MMIYRSLVIGLLGAIALLLAEQGSVQQAHVHGPPATPTVEDDEAATVVHISRRAAGHDPAEALGLGGPVRPVTIDGAAFEGGWTYALADRWATAWPGSYFELGVRGRDGVRRMVVLVTD